MDPDRMNYGKVLAEAFGFLGGQAAGSWVSANPFAGFVAGITTSMSAAELYRRVEDSFFEEEKARSKAAAAVQEFLGEGVPSSDGTPDGNARQLSGFVRESLDAEDSLLALGSKGASGVLRSWQDLCERLLKLAILAEGERHFFAERDRLLQEALRQVVEADVVRHRSQAARRRGQGAVLRAFNALPQIHRVSYYGNRTPETTRLFDRIRGTSSWHRLPLGLSGRIGSWDDDVEAFGGGGDVLAGATQAMNRSLEALGEPRADGSSPPAPELAGSSLEGPLEGIWAGFRRGHHAARGLVQVSVFRSRVIEAVQAVQEAGTPAGFSALLGRFLDAAERESSTVIATQALLEGQLPHVRLDPQPLRDAAAARWNALLEPLRELAEAPAIDPADLRSSGEPAATVPDLGGLERTSWPGP
jgi:hypothetical protein